MITIGPKSPQQTAFLACGTDFALFGGAAGGGKTAGLVLYPLHYAHIPTFRGVFFRRKAKDHGMGGGTWDEARKLLGPTGVSTRLSPVRELEWPSRAKVQFQYPEPNLAYEVQFQGLQADAALFDEWTHFDWPTVSYIHGRLRSTNGIRAIVRGSCNPDPDSWLLPWVEPYLDAEGYADRSKSGMVRWFARERDGNRLIWGDTKAGAARAAKRSEEHAFSFAFFPALATDNTVLMASDPHYSARLASSREREERLAKGNWYVRKESTGMLRRALWGHVEPGDVPALEWRVRCWDRAATVPTSETDPDFSASVLVGGDSQGRVWVGLGAKGVTAMRNTPGRVLAWMRAQAVEDGPTVIQSVPIDPGAGGITDKELVENRLRGPQIGPLDLWPQRGDKVVRASPISDELEAAKVYLVHDAWYSAPYVDEKITTTLGQLWWSQVDTFPEAPHDDFPDCAAGAFLAAKRLRGSGPAAPGVWAEMARLTRRARQW